MADEKDTDSTSESGAAARSDETIDPVEEELSPDDTTVEEESAEASEADESDDVDDAASAEDEDDADEESERELVGAGASARTARSGRDGDAGNRRGRQPKGRPTPKQRSRSTEPERTGPISFVRGSIGELKQVVYPTGSQLMNYFVVVLVFVLFIIALVTALDAGFGWLMLQVFT